MCDCCCGGLQSIAPPSVLCSLGPLFLCPVLDEWHTRHDSTSLFSYQSPLWVFSSRGSFRAWAQTPDLTQSLGCGLAARRAQDGPTARCLPLSASALLLRHVCYRSHSTLFLSASSQLPFKGIWIIIKVSLTLTRVPMPSFSFCHKNPPVYLVGQVCRGCVLSSGASGQRYAAISGSLSHLAQYPRWTGLPAPDLHTVLGRVCCSLPLSFDRKALLSSTFKGASLHHWF